MILQALPQSPQSPQPPGCGPVNPELLCCRQTQTRPQCSASSPAVPQAPTEPRPAAWVDAARSKTHSVGQTSQAGRGWCRCCSPRIPVQHRNECRDAGRRPVLANGANRRNGNHLSRNVAAGQTHGPNWSATAGAVSAVARSRPEPSARFRLRLSDPGSGNGSTGKITWSRGGTFG